MGIVSLFKTNVAPIVEPSADAVRVHGKPGELSGREIWPSDSRLTVAFTSFEGWLGTSSAILHRFFVSSDSRARLGSEAVTES